MVKLWPETEPETEAQYLASLPDADYEGKDYVILCRTEKSHELWADAENGEPVNDAVFQRSKAVEEKYNIRIKTEITAGRKMNKIVTHCR